LMLQTRSLLFLLQYSPQNLIIAWAIYIYIYGCACNYTIGYAAALTNIETNQACTSETSQSQSQYEKTNAYALWEPNYTFYNSTKHPFCLQMACLLKWKDFSNVNFDSFCSTRLCQSFGMWGFPVFVFLCS
jgi:hypothetical protein